MHINELPNSQHRTPEQLRTRLADLPKGGIAIIVQTDETELPTKVCIVEHMSGRMHLKGMYMTLTQSSGYLYELFTKHLTDFETLAFIDLNPPRRQGPTAPEKTIRLHPRVSPTELSFTITRAIETEAFEYFVLDSATAIVKTRKMQDSRDFLKFLTAKLKLFGITNLILAQPEPETANALGEVIGPTNKPNIF